LLAKLNNLSERGDTLTRQFGVEYSVEALLISEYEVPVGYNIFMDSTNHINSVARFCLSEIEVFEDLYPGFQAKF